MRNAPPGNPENAQMRSQADLMATPRNRVLRGHVEIARAALDKDRERQ